MKQLTSPKPNTKATAAEPDTAASSSPFMVEALRLGTSVLIIGCGILGMLSFGKGSAPPKTDAKKSDAALVETVDIISHEGGLDIQVDGLAVPFKEVQIAAEVAGRITFKSEECRAGNYVEKGTPLIRIDRETYDLEVRRLERQKIEAQQNLDELAVEISNTSELLTIAGDDLKLRNNEVDRQKRLSSRRVGNVKDFEMSQRDQLQSRNSQMGLEGQKRMLTTKKARLETAKDLAEIMLKKANLDLSRTEIVAPVSGVIVNAMAEADSFVQRGSSLLTLEDTSRVEVRCSLTMDELYRLWQSTDPDANTTRRAGAYDIPQAPVTVTYELAGRTFAWKGELARYDGIGLDEKTRTVPCRVVVPNPGDVKEIRNDDSLVTPKNGPPALVRGMFVNVKLHTTPSTNLVRIPEAAVRPGNRVWLVRDKKLVVRNAIVAGISGDDLLVDGDASGISADEKAIVSPLAEAVDGMAVQEIEK
jgi:multidrug efflux pump subunit AcrA (membrane-fusion protein)